jgi:hypothetical protein
MSDSAPKTRKKRQGLENGVPNVAKHEIVSAVVRRKPSIKENPWVNIPYKEGLTDLTPLLHHDVARLRGAFRDQLAAAFPLAVQAMRGDIKWSSQQVNLFRIFANKVVPDLSQSHMTVEHRREASQLTREELEAIVAEPDLLTLPNEGSDDTSD